MKQNKIYNTEQEIQKLIESTSYKEKNLDSKQEKFLDILVTYRGKRIKLRKLYEDILGYTERSIICGRCDRKGVIRKRHNYYEVRHSSSVRDTCYFGTDPEEEIIFVPTKILLKNFD